MPKRKRDVIYVTEDQFTIEKALADPSALPPFISMSLRSPRRRRRGPKSPQKSGASQQIAKASTSHAPTFPSASAPFDSTQALIPTGTHDSNSAGPSERNITHTLYIPTGDTDVGTSNGKHEQSPLPAHLATQGDPDIAGQKHQAVSGKQQGPKQVGSDHEDAQVAEIVPGGLRVKTATSKDPIVVSEQSVPETVSSLVS